MLAGMSGESFDVFARHRYHALDGLRGIAAMMVAVGHAFITVFALSGGLALADTVLTGIINGGIAVDLFFIMSGFFLTGMIEGSQSLRLYYARRLARLVPPAVASVVALYVYARLCLGPAAEDAAHAAPQYLTYQALNFHAGWRALLPELALIRHNLNPVLWTIRLEIFISVLYPAVMWLHRRAAGWALRGVLLGGLVGLAILLNAHQKLGIDVFHYLYMFYAGTLLRAAGPWLARLPAPVPGLICAAGLVILAATGELVPLVNTHPLRFDLPVTLGGALLVGTLAHGAMPRAGRFMASAPVQWLGRLSYSLYLINWLAIRGLGQAMLGLHLPQRIGLAACLAVLALGGTALTLALAVLLRGAVERPAVAWSRRLGGVRLA